MNVTAPVGKRVVGSGDIAGLDAAWTLKERVRREDAVLKQDRALFERIYRRSTVFRRFGSDGDLAGFAAARTDVGYLLVLAISPDHRRSGIGRDLVESVAEDSPRVTCHVRTDNESAMEFYREVGFSVERLVRNYYRDGGDAYYLLLGDD